MARPKSLQKTRQIRLSLDETLAARIDLILFDEVQQRVPYDAWRGVVEPLLKGWLEDLRQTQAPIPIPIPIPIPTQAQPQTK